MISKKVKLNNNLNATLNLSQLDDVYVINAVNNYNLIGECNFNIIYKYELDNNTLDPTNTSKLYKKLATEGLKVSPSRLTGYKLVDDKIKLGDLLLSYKETIIELNKIHVRDENYGEVGLGYAMFKMLEEVAKTHKASRIEANFHPFGTLKFNSQKFYKRNGFVWNKNHIYKELNYGKNKENPLIR